MTWTLEQIWRYPIKGIGAERLAHADMETDRPVPGDRAWALLEDGGDAGEGWRACRNFLRGAKGPSLMAISARSEGATFVLSHPDRPDLTIDPNDDAATEALIAWVTPIYPEKRRPPVALVKSPPEGMSDAPFPSISLINKASLRALSQKTGRDLHPLRFRGNLLVEGLAPWEEFDLVGKSLSIGGAEFEVVEPIGRCRATEANPDTGRSDTNTLAALQEGWGHTQFGAYLRVTRPGTIAENDSITVL